LRSAGHPSPNLAARNGQCFKGKGGRRPDQHLGCNNGQRSQLLRSETRSDPGRRNVDGVGGEDLRWQMARYLKNRGRGYGTSFVSSSQQYAHAASQPAGQHKRCEPQKAPPSHERWWLLHIASRHPVDHGMALVKARHDQNARKRRDAMRTGQQAA